MYPAPFGAIHWTTRSAVEREIGGKGVAILGGGQSHEAASTIGGKPPICAVVVTREKEADAANCLSSLLESDYPLSRILLIDNGSRDGSIERLAERFASRPQVEILRNEENLGYAAAANLGIRRAAGADLVLLINDDAELRRETLGRLVEALVSRPEAGLAVPRIVLAKDPTVVWRGPVRFSWIKVGAVDPERGGSVDRASVDDRCVRLATGCVLLVRSETIERLGFFDERFFLYGEDADYCFRATAAGICILFAARAVALHRVERTEPVPTSVFSAFHMGRSHVLLIRKHAAGARRVFALSVHFLAHTALLAVRLRRFTGAWRPLLGWIRGSFDGLRDTRSVSQDKVRGGRGV